MRRVAELAKRTLGEVEDVSLTLIESGSRGAWCSPPTRRPVGRAAVRARLRALPGRGQDRPDPRSRHRQCRHSVPRVRPNRRPIRSPARRLDRDAVSPAQHRRDEHPPDRRRGVLPSPPRTRRSIRNYAAVAVNNIASYADATNQAAHLRTATPSSATSPKPSSTPYRSSRNAFSCGAWLYGVARTAQPS